MLFPPPPSRVELRSLNRSLRQRPRTPHQRFRRQRGAGRVVHLAGDGVHAAPVPVRRDEIAPPRHRRLLRKLGQTSLLRLARLVLARLAAHRRLGRAGLTAAHPAQLERALARVQGHGHVPRVGSGGALALLPIVLGDPRILNNRSDFAFPAGRLRVLLVHAVRAVVGVPEHHGASWKSAVAASRPRTPRARECGGGRSRVPKESHSINFNDKGVARFALGANHKKAPCVVRRFRKKLTPRTPARNDGRPHRPRRERLKSLNAVKRSTPKCTPLTPSPWYRTRRTPASP